MSQGRGLLAVATALLVAAVLVALPAAAKPARPLFTTNDLLHLTIKAPLEALERDPAKPQKSVAGTLTVAGASAETLPITLTPRGLTRRKPGICQFQPLRVEFADKPPAGSLFAGQKRLKLVTHCRPGESFRQYVLLEYAAYRLYNALTPQSFAVRLAMIDYVDGAGKPIISRMGFFIEPTGDMARRNDLDEIKNVARIPVAGLDPQAAARFAVFETMIGNLDWSMTQGPPGEDCCHNVRLIGHEGATTGLIPVPYDFDYAGLVDAPYAAPPAIVPIDSVRERRYRGFCVHNPQVPAAVAEIQAQRTRLLGMLDAIPQLDDSARRKATSFLDRFFKTSDSPQIVAGTLLKTCV